MLLHSNLRLTDFRKRFKAKVWLTTEDRQRQSERIDEVSRKVSAASSFDCIYAFAITVILAWESRKIELPRLFFLPKKNRKKQNRRLCREYNFFCLVPIKVNWESWMVCRNVVAHKCLGITILGKLKPWLNLSGFLPAGKSAFAQLGLSNEGLKWNISWTSRLAWEMMKMLPRATRFLYPPHVQRKHFWHS